MSTRLYTCMFYTLTMANLSGAAHVSVSAEAKSAVVLESKHVPDIAPGKFPSFDYTAHNQIKQRYFEYMQSLQQSTSLPRSVLCVLFDYLSLQELPYAIRNLVYLAPLPEPLALYHESRIGLALCWLPNQRLVTSTYQCLHLWDIARPERPIKSLRINVTNLPRDIPYCPRNSLIACLGITGEVLIIKASDDTLEIQGASYAAHKGLNLSCWSHDGTCLAITGIQAPKVQHLELWNISFQADNRINLTKYLSDALSINNDDSSIKKIFWSSDNRYIILVQTHYGIHYYDTHTHSLKTEKDRLLNFYTFEGNCGYSVYAYYSELASLPKTILKINNTKNNISKKIYLKNDDLRALHTHNGIVLCSIQIPAEPHLIERIILIDAASGCILNTHEYDKKEGVVSAVSSSLDSVCLAYRDNDKQTIRIVAPSTTLPTYLDKAATSPIPAKYLSLAQKRLAVLRNQQKLSLPQSTKTIRTLSIAASAAGILGCALAKKPLGCVASAGVGIGGYVVAPHLARVVVGK